ncbi:MAG: aspartate carbamoyltransferase catalytic subunit [Gammaproteobacteria bacterium]|nr:aspartate carbamoyltransferase catalytic subunit [Gammaproteobacteria bacterium]
MPQIDQNGRLAHLLTLDGLGAARISDLLERAAALQQGAAPAAHCRGRTVANLFFEPSTRTRASFDLAAQRLGCHVLNLDLDTSSTSKGETLLDTARTLAAMGADALVIRHKEAGVHAMLAEALPDTAILNAGEAHLNHPTQGLLDALTVRQRHADFSQLHMAIVGDLKHSRVARSAVHVFSQLGMGELRLVGPDALLPEADLPGERYTDMDAGIRDCDVVMMLRIQKERMTAGNIPDASEYVTRYGLDERRLQLARKDALVMHPGPMNRGVEISDAVADGRQAVIWKQVENGVAVRMAVIETLLAGRPA